MSFRFFTLSVLALFLMLVLAACGGGETPSEPLPPPGDGQPLAEGGAEGPSVEEITADVRSAFQGLEDYHAVLEITFANPMPGKVTMDIFMQGAVTGFASGDMPDVRGEITQSDLAELPQGAVAVFAETSYFYDPTENTVLKAERDAQGGGGSQLYRIPMMFFSIITQSYEKLTSTQFTQALLGEEQVGSYATYKIECTAPDGLKDTIWVDKATSLPVKVMLDLGIGQQGATITSMEVNPGLDGSQFTFTPPAGAEEIVLGQMETAATLDEASSKAGFSAPVPGYLPADLGTEPVQIQVQSTPLGGSISQTYGTPPSEMSGNTEEGAVIPKQISINSLKSAKDLPVDKMPSSMASGTEASAVTVREQSGTLMQMGEGEEGIVILSWLENGVFYSISGIGYTADEVTRVAEGLEIK